MHHSLDWLGSGEADADGGLTKLMGRLDGFRRRTRATFEQENEESHCGLVEAQRRRLCRAPGPGRASECGGASFDVAGSRRLDSRGTV
jgi:hypothetical protein